MRGVKARTKIATAEAPDGTPIDLFEHDGAHEISIRGAGLMTSRQHNSEEILGQLAVEGLTDSPTLVVGGLGMGFTVRAALDALPDSARVLVVELIPDIVEWNRGPVGEHAGRPLDDRRVRIVEGDVLKALVSRRGQVDAIALDVDNGASAMVTGDNKRLYGPGGLAALRRALVPGGRLAIWSASDDPRLQTRMRDAGFAVTVHEAHARPRRKGARHVVFVGVAKRGLRPAAPARRRGRGRRR